MATSVVLPTGIGTASTVFGPGSSGSDTVIVTAGNGGNGGNSGNGGSGGLNGGGGGGGGAGGNGAVAALSS